MRVRWIALVAMVVGLAVAGIAAVEGMVAPTTQGALLCLVPECIGLFVFVLGLEGLLG
jgi:hypothetical protein